MPLADHLADQHDFVEAVVDVLLARKMDVRVWTHELLRAVVHVLVLQAHNEWTVHVEVLRLLDSNLPPETTMQW